MVAATPCWVMPTQSTGRICSGWPAWGVRRATQMFRLLDTGGSPLALPMASSTVSLPTNGSGMTVSPWPPPSKMT